MLVRIWNIANVGGVLLTTSILHLVGMSCIKKKLAMDRWDLWYVSKNNVWVVGDSVSSSREKRIRVMQKLRVYRL